MSRERDQLIFDLLSYGPMRAEKLYRQCFKKNDGSVVSRKVFNTYLRKLVAHKYIKVVPYNYRSSMPLRVAILDSRGADYLCNFNGSERDHIRMSVPPEKKLDHELHLSDIARSIRFEAIKYKLLLTMYDDNHAKRLNKLHNRSARKTFFADLYITIKKDNFQKSLYLELDCGNKSGSYWRQKLKSWAVDTVMVTLSNKRARRMANYARDTKLSGRVCCISLEDYYRVGLNGCIDIFFTSDPFTDVFLFNSQTETWDIVKKK